jgi:hypothetical protein
MGDVNFAQRDRVPVGGPIVFGELGIESFILEEPFVTRDEEGSFAG